MNSATFPFRLELLQTEFHQELIAIGDWWATHSPDREHGGFHGEIDANNLPVKNATKGIILNARILWFFSEISLSVSNPLYRECADRAYEYIAQYFVDPEYGGVFWELDFAGKVLNDKKQIYAQAFAIYAFATYYQLTKNEKALKLALSCFALIEDIAVDPIHEGYLEAFTRSWQPIEDLRLSEKDLNFPKSQNTHLHVLEAYTRLHNAYPNAPVREALRYNVELFDKHMIDKQTYHLRMFMDLDWSDHSPGFTYGHDIEASWLIAQALDSLQDETFTRALTPMLINIAIVTLSEAIGEHGEVLDAFDFASKSTSRDKVWWVQAEALVGFLYAFNVTRNTRFLMAAENVWAFIKSHQIDKERGEWYWLSTLDDSPAGTFYKAGFWKCPYHNGRAMLESARYLARVLEG